MKKTFVFIAILALFSVAPSAHACSPAPSWPPSASENLSMSDVAFVGTVASVMQDKSIYGDYHITFSVDAAYKGDLEETVTVKARSSSAACGYDDGYDTFEKGTVWAIYADKEEGGYATDSLSLNTEYRSVAAAKEALEGFGFIEVDEAPIACTMQYQPVCGKAKNGTMQTYGNACALGADKATMLYEGECKVESNVPAKDLWQGMRGMDVTWLQEFLIGKASGAASNLLKAVGATGYFGALTKDALAEYQRAHGIMPAAGYFGTKTRAQVMEDATPPATIMFEGTIEAVSTACFADGICSVTVDGKEVVVTAGMRVDVPPLGSLKGVDSIGDLENEIGSKARVYAAVQPQTNPGYTLYGSTEYYVEVLK